MHRFDVDNVAFARRMRDKGLFVSISSGVKPADYEVIDRLATDGVGADYITIDIAHGHADTRAPHDRPHQEEAARAPS